MSVKVQINMGIVEGFLEGNIRKWYGIPYAEQPIGDLRFKKTKAKKSWKGVLETKRFSPKCPQLPTSTGKDNGLEQNEDCLYLNIWAPKDKATKLPVIFWIHGGALASGEGSNDAYYGDSFAENGVILVTFNYRLGIFGGFYNLSKLSGLEEYVPNAGVYDVLEALKWVNENIQAFGGDVNNITIMGESAGATIVAALMHLPYAKGLFHKAILQSMSNLTFKDDEEFYEVERLLDAYGLGKEDASNLLHMNTEELMEGQNKYSGGNAMNAQCRPVVDGKLFTGHLVEIIEKGDSQGIPILIGTNCDEGSMFLEKVDHWNKDARVQMLTDKLFVFTTTILANKQSKTDKAFVYRFDFTPAIAKSIKLKAYHGAEIVYVFNTLNSSMANVIKGVKEAKEISNLMHFAWIQFAKTSNPGWNQYNEKDQAFFVFDTESHLEKGYSNITSDKLCYSKKQLKWPI